MTSFVQELKDAAAISWNMERRRQLTLAAEAVAGWLHIVAAEGDRESMQGLNAAAAIAWRIMCQEPPRRA